jgi:hypothetical protein
MVMVRNGMVTYDKHSTFIYFFSLVIRRFRFANFCAFSIFDFKGSPCMDGSMIKYNSFTQYDRFIFIYSLVRNFLPILPDFTESYSRRQYPLYSSP